MSMQAMVWVMHRSNSAGLDRLVLLMIADEADDYGGNAHPSLARIAAKANIDRRTAMRCVQSLEQLGELRVIRPTVTGRGRHNRYELTMYAEERWQGVTDNCSERCLTVTDTVAEKVTSSHRSARKGDTTPRKKVTAVSPDPAYRPIEKKRESDITDTGSWKPTREGRQNLTALREHLRGAL